MTVCHKAGTTRPGEARRSRVPRPTPPTRTERLAPPDTTEWSVGSSGPSPRVPPVGST